MMRRYREIQRVLSLYAGGAKGRWAKLASPERLRLMLKVGLPLSLLLGFAGFFFWAEGYLKANPGLREKFKRQWADSTSGAAERSRSNPWGSSGLARDPKGFLLSFFASSDPALRARFVAVLDQMPHAKVAFLAKFLGAIELSPAQRQRFVALLENLMRSKAPEQNLGAFVNIAETVIQKVREAVVRRQVADVAKLPAAPGTLEEVVAKEVEKVMSVIMTPEEPESFSTLLEVVAEMPRAVADQVTRLAAALAVSNAKKLIEVLSLLNPNEVKPVVQNLARFTDGPVGILVDRFSQSSASQIVEASRVIMTVSTPVAERFIELTASFSNTSFYAAINLVRNLGANRTDNLVGVGEKLSGGADLERMVIVMEKLGGQNQIALLDVLGGFKREGINKLVDVSERLASSESVLSRGLSILTEVKSPAEQQKAVEILDNLNQDNLKRAVDVLDVVETKTVREAIEVADGLTGQTQNDLINQFDRLRVNKIEVPTFVVKTPTTVAGVRGKTTTKEFVYKPKRDEKDRLELIIGKLYELDDSSLTTDLVKANKELSDRALKQGADVFIDLDIRSDKKRAQRLVKTYHRLDLMEKENAIDTLYDITDAHVTAAIDIADKSDDHLLKQSVKFTHGLKSRLGRKEGFDATMRLINIASLTSGKTRQDGLNSLETEKTETVRKVLKQVDGHREAFNPVVVTNMVNLHITAQPDWVAKFSTILSGSEGLELGAKAGSGVSRFITQDRKLIRIAQYLSDEPEHVRQRDFRTYYFGTRPVKVPLAIEDSYSVGLPQTTIRDKTRIAASGADLPD